MEGQQDTFMKRLRAFVLEKRYGVLGTLIFHLLLVLMLLGMEISKMETHTEIEIEIEMPDEEFVQQFLEEQQRREEILKQNASEEVEELLRSIAVNEEIKPRQENASETLEKYMEEIREELREDVRDRYGDRYTARKDRNHSDDSLQMVRDRRQRELDSLQSTVYVGESSVSYSLKDRYKIDLPIPIFKCEFGGKVVVAIVVNPKGVVIKADIIEAESKKDDCLREVAVNAALRSRFNQDDRAPERQSGTITYNFVKQ